MTSSTRRTSAVGGRETALPRRSSGHWFAQGGWPARPYGAGDQAVCQHGPAGPMRVGCLRSIFAGPATLLCGGCRPITSTSTRCTTSTGARRGTRSGKPWRCCAPGQDTLCRVVQLCGMAHCQSAGRGAQAQFMGLVSEQSLYNLLARHIELEVLPAAADFGVGIIPWSPLQSGLLGGVVRKSARAAAAISVGRKPPTGCAPSLRRMKTSASPWGRSRLRWHWLGCSPVQLSLRRLSDPARWSSSRAHCDRSRSPSTNRRSSNSTPSSRVTAPRRKATPGTAPIEAEEGQRIPIGCPCSWASRGAVCGARSVQGFWAVLGIVVVMGVVVGLFGFAAHHL